jgi:hypothetical protein
MCGVKERTLGFQIFHMASYWKVHLNALWQAFGVHQMMQIISKFWCWHV